MMDLELSVSIDECLRGKAAETKTKSVAVRVPWGGEVTRGNSKIRRSSL